MKREKNAKVLSNNATSIEKFYISITTDTVVVREMLRHL